MRVAVLLAAGSSRRWGAGNKLFARAGGATLLARSLRAARAAAPGAPLVVTGWQASRVARAVRGLMPAARIVRARDHAEGLGASLRAAARALRPIEREAWLFLADMPRARAFPVIGRRGAIVRPAWRGRPGHPVLLRGAALAALHGARGDAGPGRGGDATAFVAGRRGSVADVDTRRATRRAGLR